MKTNKRYATAVLGSLLAAAILAGVALAGNPHGTPPGHAKGQVNASVATSSTAGNSVGVKSSSTTHFNTQAAATSNGTKAYGNGSTAGQIAVKNGAGQATLYGPGNSQPHKTLCPGGKHMVDVHALKAHGGGSCAAGTSGSTSTSTTSTSTSTPTSATGSVSGSASVTAPGTAVAAQAHTAAKGNAKGAFKPPRATRTGGVLGASVVQRARPARPVVGAANFTG